MDRIILRLLLLISCFALMGCENPLGEADSRDSQFSPGGGGSGGGGGSTDSSPPGIPTSLALASQWVTGSNPANSPLFSWNNPSDDDFANAEVALGVTIGGQELVPFTESSSPDNHIFAGISFTECSSVYYPTVRALDASGNQSTPASLGVGFQYDNTNPNPVGGVTIPANDATSASTVTVDWSAAVGSDNCGIAGYEIALGYDDDADGFDTGDINNLIDWSTVPGGQATTSYQIQDGVDGFSFSATFERQYYISIRVVDEAGLMSGEVSSAGWYTFHPTQFANLEMWFDSTDASTLFQDSTCNMTPAVNPGDPVSCWRDKANTNHAIQAGGNEPRIGATGVHFDGTDDFLQVAGKNYVFTDDFTFYIFYEADTQSNNGGSCCRPIVSFANASTGLFPWLALTRGNLGPNNNLFHGWNGAGISYIPTSPGDLIVVGATHDGTNSLWNAFSFGLQRATNEPLISYTNTPFNIGGDSNNAARRVAGEVYEVIVIESILNTTERENLEGYLACKHDARDTLDVSHPYYDLVGANKTGCP